MNREILPNTTTEHYYRTQAETQLGRGDRPLREGGERARCRWHITVHCYFSIARY